MDGMVMNIPPALKWGSSSNISEAWKLFKQRMEIYMKATENDKKEDGVKVAILLNIGGEELIKIYNNLQFATKVEEAEKEKNNYRKVMELVEKYCNSRKNVVYERYCFNRRVQQQGESFDRFLSDIQRKATTCDYINVDSQIRDKIVLGITDLALQASLLEVDNLSMEKAIQKCRTSEINKQQTAEVQKVRNEHVDPIKHKDYVNKQHFNKGNNYRNINNNSNVNNKESEFFCKKCEKRHGVRKCPAYNFKCKQCNRVGHFTQPCFFKRIHTLDKVENKAEYRDNQFVVESVKNINLKSSEWVETMIIENQKIKFKIDTGSDLNILPKYNFENLNTKKKVKETNIILETFGGFQVKPIGEIDLQIEFRMDSFVQKFIIVNDVGTRPIIGLKTSKLFKLVKKSGILEIRTKLDLIKENSMLFKGLGCLPMLGKIIIKKGSIPVVKAPRRIPIMLKDRFKGKLDELEQSGIISKVNKAVVDE